MKTITQTIDININNQLCIKDNLFFDIETTGFSRTGCFCYLIGVSFTDGRHFTVIQWLAEGASDEPLLIHKFCELAENFSSIIHFNGDNFDIPFLTKRAAIHNIPLNLDNMRSIDLFKHAKGLKSILRLESYNQTTVEHFLGIHRNDTYTGGELIKVYKEYIKNDQLPAKHADSEKLLLLHNFEDICGLIKISSIVSYNNIINKHISYKDIEYTPAYDIADEDKQSDNISSTAYITLSFSLPEELPVSVLLKDEYYVLRAEHSTLKLRLPVITGILKYFYPNYKDYYYLPYEDTAMHKSIAAYVDSECRIKATKETCYTKKHGTFIMIPSYSGDMTIFKKDYNDKNVYLILDPESTDKTVSDYDTKAIKNMLSTDIIHETAYAIITFFYKRTAHYTHNQDPYS
uniref:ribonuclease H-like domain-containing protein n=1 Tax=Lachnospira sp. TaxID=2049031 RepID=UPI003FEF6691